MCRFGLRVPFSQPAVLGLLALQRLGRADGIGDAGADDGGWAWSPHQIAQRLWVDCARRCETDTSSWLPVFRSPEGGAIQIGKSAHS